MPPIGAIVKENQAIESHRLDQDQDAAEAPHPKFP
jgi:hypothetical protein